MDCDEDHDINKQDLVAGVKEVKESADIDIPILNAPADLVDAGSDCENHQWVKVHQLFPEHCDDCIYAIANNHKNIFARPTRVFDHDVLISKVK